MDTVYPVMSLKTASILKNVPVDELSSQITPANTFYDKSLEQFITEFPSLNLAVKTPEETRFHFSQEMVHFNLQQYSSVYEITLMDSAPSTLLRASNLETLLGDYVELSSAVDFVVPAGKFSPILIGNKGVIERLVHGIPEDRYTLFPGENVKQLKQKG